ncbi:transglycosylase domain-containing protein [Lentibacillus halophilus]|uniref:Transglycosylase domain-containing protein n=1 Tax=Lentibacillus halophilus TaxID=295065 RepID=A0ABP3J263_9BACI
MDKTMKRLKWLLLSLLFLLVIGIIGYAVILFGGRFVVDEDDLILDATTTLETRNGEVIGKLYHENRIPVTLESIPDHVQEAFIATEDRRFYDHAGIDFQSIARAVYRDIIAMDKVEGASTITQQLAKNLFLTNDKTWMRKTKEAMAAIHLERRFSKNKILELYLNEVYFGHGVYGIEAASRMYFNKSAQDLTLSEGALLAGLVKAPNGYSPIRHPKKAETRRNVVLEAMEDTENIATQKRMQAQGRTLGLNIQTYEPKPWAAGFIDLAVQKAADRYHLSMDELQRGGYRIVVTVHPEAQKIAYRQFQNDSHFPGNTDGVQGAFVMLDQQSGEVAAAMSGRNYEFGNLNRVTVKRQPGSAIKPLAVYGPAMMTGNYDPYSLIQDKKQAIDGYTPTNYDGQYAGSVSIYQALIESKNAAAVWLLNDIGIPYAKDYLNQLGMPIQDDGLAIALGGLSEGVTPLKMAQSYRAFANSGKTIDAFAIEKMMNRDDEVIHQADPETTSVFRPQVAWNMTRMLSSAVADGTASAGHYSKALAGKTGSTQHPHVEGAVKDAWFAGFTPKYAMATWIGYDTSDKTHYLTTGSEAPTRLTKAILSEMNNQTPLTASFDKPANVSDLPEPIDLPTNITLHGNHSFGGLSFLKGTLEWTESADDRIVYRIYREEDGSDEQIGKVKGDNEYTIKPFPFFDSSRYYVVPYNPLTDKEGKKSNTVKLSLNKTK